MIRKPAGGCLRAPAFTMAEMVISLAIVGVLAAIAVPRFSRAITRQRVENAANRLMADLDYAATLARTSGTPVQLKFVKGTQPTESYYFFKVAPDNMTYEVVLRDEPYGVILKNAPDRLDFDIYGMPDGSKTFELRGGDAVRVVSIDRDTGEVTLQ